jgi:hypothetical protein
MGPDIIVLQEIENKNVLTKLVSKGLDKLGYQYQVLIEGDDSRGIDIAILSKYPVKTAKRHPIFVKGTKLNTRGILEVEVTVDGKDVAIFGNHWPSQHNPTDIILTLSWHWEILILSILMLLIPLAILSTLKMLKKKPDKYKHLLIQALIFSKANGHH